MGERDVMTGSEPEPVGVGDRTARRAPVLSRRAAGVLLAAAAWTLVVWLTRIKNLVGDDRSAGFKVVHVSLAAVSVAFAIAIGWIGLTAWRRSRRV